MIAFFIFVTLIGYTAMMTARWINRKQESAPQRQSVPPPTRPSSVGGPVPSPRGDWTALDEIQLNRLLTDSESS